MLIGCADAGFLGMIDGDSSARETFTLASGLLT